MKPLFKKLALALTIIGLASSASAFNFGSTSTFSYVNWSVSMNTNSFSSLCNNIRLDVTGDFVNSSNMVVYGALNCPALNGSYPATGTAYFDINGAFNMNLTIGNGYSFGCRRLFELSGVCTINNSSGTSVGTAYITLN